MSVEVGMHCPVKVCNRRGLKPGGHVTDMSQTLVFGQDHIWVKSMSSDQLHGNRSSIHFLIVFKII